MHVTSESSIIHLEKVSVSLHALKLPQLFSLTPNPYGKKKEVLSRLRSEVEEQLQSFMSNKVEISYEKERISKLHK